MPQLFCKSELWLGINPLAQKLTFAVRAATERKKREEWREGGKEGRKRKKGNKIEHFDLGSFANTGL